MTGVSLWRKALPVATPLGLGLGVAIGLLAGAQNWGALLAVLLSTGALAAATRVLAPEDRRLVGLTIALAFVSRLALGAVIWFVSSSRGSGGFVTGDDIDYATMGWAVAQYLLGTPIHPYYPPLWAGNDYLVGTYVYFETAIFLLFGRNVPVVLVVNAAIAAGTLVILYGLARELFGKSAARASTLMIAFVPSLVLWSSLNLKDAMALLLASAVLSLLNRFARGARVSLLVSMFLLLLPLEGMRKYLFVGLALVIPIAVAITPRLRPGSRAAWAGSAFVLSGALLFITGYSGWVNPAALSSLEVIRSAMASGARTGFYEPIPIDANDGATFLVPGEGDPEVVNVPQGGRVVLDDGSPRQAGVIYVRPGSIVVVGPSGQTPAPERRTLTFNERSGTPTAQFGSRPDDRLVFERTLAHLPRGLAYAYFAPFPWEVRRPADLATMPEMLLWYGSLPAAAWTAWRSRTRWRLVAPLVLFVLGLMSIFVLTEGNVGILFRHRGMVIPYVLILAAPGFLALVAAIGGGVPDRIPSALHRFVRTR